jgi:hypothetical protein
MPYMVTKQDIENTTDVELAFATTRLLPEIGDIPIEFINGNLYTKTVEAIFLGLKSPGYNMKINIDVSPGDISKCVAAHLKSFEPTYEHKIAGVGYMLSKIATLSIESAEGRKIWHGSSKTTRW